MQQQQASAARDMPSQPLHVLFSLASICFVLPASSGEDQFTFNGFAGANLSLDGTATVMPGGLLMLTNGTIQMKGHAFYPTPLQLRAPATGGGDAVVRSFSTAFVFGIIGQYVDLSTHGMAFLVAPTKDLSAAMPGQFLGLVNASSNGDAANRLLAVELDTLRNPELQDMDSNHVGIDVNGVVSLRAESAGYYDDDTGAFQNLTLISRKAMQVWVDYDGEAAELNVTIAPLEAAAKPKKPLLSTPVDLSAVVTGAAYVGFSSATGILFSRHYVLGWSFKLDGAAPALDIAKLPALPRTSPKPRPKALAIVLPMASAALVFAAATAVFIIVRRRLKFAEIHEDWEVEFGPHRFSYKDLFHATEGFKDKHLLGAGGFGRVYKGVLRKSQTEVAVKRVSHESRQGIKEFVTEVVTIGCLRHRNLVQLLGYCRRKGELLLVYGYMPNGSLDKYLHDRGKPPLDWARRFQVIKGVASGLLYLHEDWERVVIHRDIKASNVLLDAEMNARLGDFGLARLYDHGTDAHTTHVVGTMGYLAPELGQTGKATRATDVFAFGAFLLEVACGRRPVEQDAHDNRLMLVDRVLEHWRKGSINGAADPRLSDEFVPEEASLVLRLGLLCSHPLPGARPGMRQVMQYLDGDMSLPELSPAYLSFSMIAQMQKEGNPCFMSHPGSASSTGAMSDLSGGR